MGKHTKYTNNGYNWKLYNNGINWKNYQIIDAEKPLVPKSCFYLEGEKGVMANLLKLLKNIINPLPFRFFLSIKKKKKTGKKEKR